MVTLLPPPKRRKLYHGVPEPVKEPESPSPSIVVQFVNEEDGKALACCEPSGRFVISTLLYLLSRDWQIGKRPKAAPTKSQEPVQGVGRCQICRRRRYETQARNRRSVAALK